MIIYNVMNIWKKNYQKTVLVRNGDILMKTK